jgi:hypothetical protein
VPRRRPNASASDLLAHSSERQSGSRKLVGGGRLLASTDNRDKEGISVKVEAIDRKLRPSMDQERKEPAHDKPDTVHAQAPTR